VRIVKAVSDFHSEGNEVILVSSGAVGLGRGRLGWKGDLTIEQKQACAAVGQSLLMNQYALEFHKYGKTVAQVLLTKRDLSRREGYLNVQRTFHELLKNKVIPIVNENDTVSISELTGETFGDNDRLSALVAGKLDVQELVLLTNVDGLFDKNPSEPGAQLISKIKGFKDLQSVSLEGKSGVGRGGMKSKLDAAKIASVFGVKTWIASGFKPEVLTSILKRLPVVATEIDPAFDLSSRKRWIGFSSGVQGELKVNKGAEEALRKKTSLLPKGIIEVKGNFPVGAVVSVINEEGLEIGRGVTDFTDKEVGEILGKHSSQIADIVKRKSPTEVIHRDKMVVFEEYSN
jgi:glutamate 5-kinase